MVKFFFSVSKFVGTKKCVFTLNLSISNIYLSMSTTFGSKDIVIRKSEFMAKTQFLYFHKEIISSSPLCNDDNNIE